MDLIEDFENVKSCEERAELLKKLLNFAHKLMIILSEIKWSKYFILKTKLEESQRQY